MTNFWKSGTGAAITGEAKNAFLEDFGVIPEGTTAKASIKEFCVVNKEATQYAEAQKFLQITYKLLDGDYKNRQVTQKIKVFEGKPEQIDRNLNMLKLVMDLCSFKPANSNEPTNDDLVVMVGKIVGVKIKEWSLPKNDGTMMEGNYVSEVYAAAETLTDTGVKLEVKHVRKDVESAFSRNAAAMDLDQDLPF